MKKLNELSMREVLHVAWGKPEETFTRMLTLCFFAGLLFIVFGESWLFSFCLIFVCLLNWFWRLYSMKGVD
jgi:hypothetical protein